MLMFGPGVWNQIVIAAMRTRHKRKYLRIFKNRHVDATHDPVMVNTTMDLNLRVPHGLKVLNCSGIGRTEVSNKPEHIFGRRVAIAALRLPPSKRYGANSIDYAATSYDQQEDHYDQQEDHSWHWYRNNMNFDKSPAYRNCQEESQLVKGWGNQPPAADF